MSIVEEGFICPYCLVGFATSGKLQSHFVEMHSGNEAGVCCEGGEDPVGAPVGYGQLGEEEVENVDGFLGHQFVQRRMQKPSSCFACEEIIWQDGIVCQSCSVVIHIDGCREKLTVPCSASSEKPHMTRENGVQRSAGPQQPAKGPLALVRRQIAKGRDRFVNEEFDLDLTYITERIIAMSFPATGMESTYRNSLKDVAKMLKTKHQEHYMIFNLSERSYDISRFNNQVLDFGWPDHLAPSLERLSSVCRSMKSWLDTDPQHVVVVHCKGGKGRTGCVIAAFMNYSEICQSAEAALDRFAMKRFYDSKCVGVTQPSQRKYVYYFSDLLAGKISLKTPPVVLNHVIIHGVPNCDGKGGCRVFLKVYVNMKLEHTTELHVSNEEEERIKISLHGGGLSMQGEVLVKCFHKKSHAGMDPVFRCQFHTAIVKDTLRLVLKKDDLDDAFKDKKFPENAKVEMLFEGDQETARKCKEDVDVRSSLLENPKSNGTAELSEQLESNSKRDSYANFEGGYDSGAPDTAGDLIRFSPTSPQAEKAAPSPQETAGKRKNRTESTTSFSMDPEAIERFAQPGSDHLYTVVNKKAPGTSGTSTAAPKGPSPPAPRGRDSWADPPYVNQASFPASTASDKPVLYRKSPTAASKRVSRPPQFPVPHPRVGITPLQPTPKTDVDYDEVPDEEEEDEEEEEGKQALQVKQVSQGRPDSQAITLSEGGKETRLKANGIRTNGVTSTKGETTYDEISMNQPMRLQPATPRHSAQDNDAGWCKFKFQTLPSNKGDTGQRSSSSSNPTLGSNSGEMYSNLGDLFVGGAFVGESQRRHSFTEGDERIVIRGEGPRDSIIQVAGGTPSEPDYNNIQVTAALLASSEEERDHQATIAGQEEALYTNPEDVISALNLEVKSDKRQVGGGYYNLAVTPGSKSVVPMPKGSGVVPPPPPSSSSGAAAAAAAVVDDEDYMNQEPEGMFHTYSNQKELLEQLQAGNNPVPEPMVQNADIPAVQGGENKISAMFKNLISKTPFVKRQPNEIHSQTITDIDRQKTLQPFALDGSAQAGRDYEAFFKASAWGAAGSSQRPRPEKPDKPDKPEKPDVKSERAERPSERPSARPERPRKPPELLKSRHEKPDTPDVANAEERLSRLRPQVMFPPDAPPAPRETPRVSPPVPHIPSSTPSGHPPQLPARRPHPPLQAKCSIPTPHSTPSPLGSAKVPSGAVHRRVVAVRSVDQSSHSKEARELRPVSHVAQHPVAADGADFSEGRAVGGARGRNPPQKPPPYIPRITERNRVPSETKVRTLMSHWYKPNITREEAIELVRQMDDGAFIVRDSTTVSGGYALTIKVSAAIVRQRKKMVEGAVVPEDMRVTHFLIQPDPEGVKLQGWNERAFKSLAEFIAHHTVEKLCLPCTLVLPKTGPGGEGGGGRGRGGGGDGGEGGAALQVRRRPVTMEEALKTGAACDLIYLGSLDVEGPGSEVALAQTVQQMKSLDISVSVVTFKASKEGITISYNVNGMYIKRQYPISSLTYCGADPNDTRWDFPQLQHLGDSTPITNAPCFGVFTRLLDGGGHSCLMFAQYSSTQPVTSVLSYLHQVMQRHRQK